MSKVVPYKQLSRLFAGRWQIPLALVAAALGATALYRLVPEPPKVDVEAALADVSILEQTGDPLAAARSVNRLLLMEPALPQDEQARLHDRAAELLFDYEAQQPDHSINRLNELLEHDRAAVELGRPLTPRAALREPYAQMWLGEEETALTGFWKLMDQDLPSEDRRKVVKTLAWLLTRYPDADVDRQTLFDQILSSDEEPAEYVWWALQNAVHDALANGQTETARRLIEDHRQRLTDSNLRGYLDYLDAAVLVREGRTQEAEPLVATVEQWLEARSYPTHELDDFGDLETFNRWLTAQIELAEYRPQGALQACDDVLSRRTTADVTIAATIGRGLALAMLNRHPAAREAFETALERLSLLPGLQKRAAREFQNALLDLFRRQMEQGEFSDATAYLEMAADLTPDGEPQREADLREQLGQVYQEAAKGVAGTEAGWEFHERAGQSFERAAELVGMDEARLAELLWSAAQEFDQAGRLASVRRVLERFIPGRTQHPRMPRALLMLGQAYEGAGDLESALKWYGRVVSLYPKLEEAARARVLSAQALLSLGPERYPEAERVLSTLLVDGSVSPDASVFRDALLVLCELLNAQGRYADTIGRLEDFEALYPNDGDGRRVQFMLANAYRRSAQGLRSEADDGLSAEARAAEANARLRKAADLYAQLLHDLEARSWNDEVSATYARLALFYWADSLFELNEPETLQTALAAYRSAAARYEGEPAALTAHVQIANIFLRRGDLTEATRALERAHWLLRAIPDEAFEHGMEGDREHWERFLTTALSSDLLRDVFAPQN